MATTTVQEPTGPQAVPPPKAPEKRAHAGRPPKPIAPPPSAEEGSFWEWLDSIPRDDWQNLICYVWRTGPFLNLSQTSGKPISLEKVAQPFDVNYMLKTHGSGGYRFDVCYSQPNGTEKKRIRQAYETIIDMRYPPRVPAGEWLDDPRNKEWAWCKPELEAAEKHRVLEAAAKLNGTAEPQQSKTEELSDMLDLVNKLKPAEGNANTALLLELIKMNDPSKAFTLAKEIAGMAAPAPQNQDNSITAMLLKFLMEDRRALMDQRANAPDPLESATKLITGAKGLFEGMGMGLGGPAGNPGKPDMATAVVSTIGDIIGKAVDQFGPYFPQVLGVIQHVKDRDYQIAQLAQQRNMDPQRPWAYQGPAQPQQQRPAPPVNAPPVNAAAPPPVNTPAPAPAPMTPQVLFQKYQQLFNRQFTALQHAFKHEDGFYMMDIAIEQEGRANWDEFRKDASVELLMGLVNAIPQLQQIFTPADEARAFFAELMSDPDAARPDQEDDEDETLPKNAEVVSHHA